MKSVLFCQRTVFVLHLTRFALTMNYVCFGNELCLFDQINFKT